MARIQVLPLPAVVVGELVEQPFAFVVDQVDDSDASRNVQFFAEALGARGVIFIAGTLDVVTSEQV